MRGDRKKIMVFIDWYLPGTNAGGPVRTCANMISRLRHEYDFYVVTRDTDLNANQPYAGIKSNEWNELADGTRVFYFSSAAVSMPKIRELIQSISPDIVHLNSMYSWNFTVLPLRAAQKLNSGIKIILGPRGMLSRGALAIKPLKKQLFIRATKMTGIFKNVIWHASTPVEAEEVRRTFGENVPVRIAIDLAPESTFNPIRRNKKSGEVNLFYLGRISPVKNLLGCIRALRVVPTQNRIRFDIYGPVEDVDYWKSCESEIAALPAHITVTYKGNLVHEQLHATLAAYHFLFLLTENENYGHAIVEAFTCGCPVIISDRTPWRNLESIRVGWDLDLRNQEKIVQTLNTSAIMDQETYYLWSEAARAKGNEIANSLEAKEAYRKLFL